MFYSTATYFGFNASPNHADSKHMNVTTVLNLRDFRLPLRFKWDIHSSGMLPNVDWYLVNGVSGQPTRICRIFKGQFFKRRVGVSMLVYKVYYFTKNIILHISKYDMLNVQYFIIKVHNDFDWPFLFIHTDCNILKV